MLVKIVEEIHAPDLAVEGVMDSGGGGGDGSVAVVSCSVLQCLAVFLLPLYWMIWSVAK